MGFWWILKEDLILIRLLYMYDFKLHMSECSGFFFFYFVAKKHPSDKCVCNDSSYHTSLVSFEKLLHPSKPNFHLLVIVYK